MAKEIKLTTEQLDALNPYVKFFGTAVRSRYASHPGNAALDKMRQVYEAATGTRHPSNPACGSCYFDLVLDLARLYFAQRPEENIEHKTVFYADENGNLHKEPVKKAAAPAAPATPKPAKPAKAAKPKATKPAEAKKETPKTEE